jgi:hypothetical protein
MKDPAGMRIMRKGKGVGKSRSTVKAFGLVGVSVGSGVGVSVAVSVGVPVDVSVEVGV